MLQMFRIDVVKVDRDIAYVAMAIHVCCKHLFQMFHLFFQMYVASVFIGMLCMFHIYIFTSVFVRMLYKFDAIPPGIPTTGLAEHQLRIRRDPTRHDGPIQGRITPRLRLGHNLTWAS
jgi:hypothetical protein